MNTPKIITRPDEVRDTVKDAIGESNLYIEAYGVHQNNEVSDYRVGKDDKVNYHYHDHGYELFTILSGSVECVLGGKRCIAHTGDMILVKPFTPHAFAYLEDGTVWQEVILELSLYENERSLGRVVQNCPEKLEDPEFMRRFQAGNGRRDYPGFPVLDSELVEPRDMPTFRAKGDSYKSYSFPGITCNMKFAKWDLGGVKEVWELVLDQGYTLKWEFVHTPDLFIVKEGSVRVEVQNCETQIARKGDIIHIPSYTRHTITALEKNTVLHDFNCEMDLLMMLEELTLRSASNPALRTDEEFLAALKESHGCPVAWAGYSEEVSPSAT